MKLFEKNYDSDGILIEKKQYERKEEFIKRIIPHRNHKVFQYNKETKELSEAVFYNIPTITWEDAVEGNFTKYRKIEQEENCIYFSALNRKNAYKILKREYNIDL